LSVAKKTRVQDYPRIQDEGHKYYGFLDENRLNPHTYKMPTNELKGVIIDAIDRANKKSGRTILGNIPEDISEEELGKLYRSKGRELFQYFIKYCEDPASTAYQCYGKHFADVAKEQFRNKTLQRERMNSGWRYQFIAKGTAARTKRFHSISDINSAEADFNATVGIRGTKKIVNIYVSVKNRTNTMGGQDWPKAIRALEQAANTDRNRTGPYICVFGIAMQRGSRMIKIEQRSGTPHSHNTEVWLSDFFWPFFSNFSYKEIITEVLSVLLERAKQHAQAQDIPKELIESFGACCRENGLINENGIFHDSYKLVALFCAKKEIKAKTTGRG